MSSSSKPQEIDHLMLRVHNVDRAGELFEQLGFSVTPRSDFMGLANRLVCFAPPADSCSSFIELIAVKDAELAPAAVLSFLPQSEGPASVVVAGADAHAFAQSVGQQDGELPTTLDLTRVWRLGGETLPLAFSVCIPPQGRSPVHWSYIQHKTPWHYRQPAFLGHRNGAVRLTELLLCADNPAQVGHELASVWQAQLEVEESFARVALAHTSIRIMTPALMALSYEGIQVATDTRIVGVTVAVRDLEQLKRIAAGPWRNSARGIYLQPERTFNCLISFELDG